MTDSSPLVSGRVSTSGLLQRDNHHLLPGAEVTDAGTQCSEPTSSTWTLNPCEDSMESQEGGKGPFSPCIPIGDRTVAWLGGQYKVLCPFALRQKGHESTCMYIHV